MGGSKHLYPLLYFDIKMFRKEKEYTVRQMRNLIITIGSVFIASVKLVYVILTPQTPLLYRKNGVYRGIRYFFFISAIKHRLWVPVRTASMRRF